jgi:cytosine/adenosine deaminase-related metal-dependent hydrolase
MNPFYDKLRDEIRALGGMHNAHLHLDRVYTLDDHYIEHSGHRILENSHISLQKKHSLINALHSGPAYEEEDLRRRVNACLDAMVACDTRRADTLVDVSADAVGTSALDVLMDIKRQRAGQIDVQVGAYSPLGFRDDEPQRWDMLIEGARRADFVACLPEADDTDDYPENIGFDEHCRRNLELAREKGCMLHVHTDQRNEPGECGTERLLDAIEKYGGLASEDGDPGIWAIHMISPSTYDEPRFERLVRRMVELDVGVICCPSAAIGMRQLRPVMTPTYNSIPRVLEMLVAGVRVLLASDNIADICSPSTTPDLVDEVYMLSAALRFYDVGILARLASGKGLDEAQREAIRVHLAKNTQEIEKVVGGHT